jgi:hypothetical protein
MKKEADPICPINRFFEGDENVCNEEACDYDLDFRFCSEACLYTTRKDNGG